MKEKMFCSCIFEVKCLIIIKEKKKKQKKKKKKKRKKIGEHLKIHGSEAVENTVNK